MIDKKILVIIILATLLIGIGGVYAYQKIEKKIYNQGYQDAVLIINQQIINNVVQNGYINLIVPLNTTQGQEVFNVKLGIVNSTRIK